MLQPTETFRNRALRGRWKRQKLRTRRGQATPGARLEPPRKKETRKRKKKTSEGKTGPRPQRGPTESVTGYRQGTKCTPKRPSQSSYNTRPKEPPTGPVWTFRVSARMLTERTNALMSVKRLTFSPIFQSAHADMYMKSVTSKKKKQGPELS